MEIIFVTAKTPLILLLAIATVIASALGSWCWCSDKEVCHDGEIQKRFSNSFGRRLGAEVKNKAEISDKDDCCSNCFAAPVDASLTNFDNHAAKTILCLVATVFAFGCLEPMAEQGRPHFVASRFASSGTGWDICLNKRSLLI